MASGQARRQREAERASGVNQQVVNAQLQPSYGETALGRDAQSVLDYKGDNAGLPGLIMPTFYQKLKGEQAQQNRGAATFGAQNADPNLLAGLNATQEANAGQMDSLAFQDAVGSRQDQARQEAGQSAALQGGRLSSLGGQTSSYATNANEIASRPGFWQQFLFQAMSNAQRAASAGMGAP